MKDQFEKFVKESVDQFDVPYNEAHWNKISAQLDRKSGMHPGKWALGGAGALVLGVALWMAWPQNTDTPSIKPSSSTLENKPEVIRHETLEHNTESSESKGTEMEPVRAKSGQVISSPSNLPQLPSIKENSPSNPEIVIKKSGDNSFDASFTVNRLSGCTNESFLFSANASLPVSYRWTFGDGSESRLPNPSHRYDKPGKYGVTLTLTSIIDGRSVKLNEGTVIQVSPSPSARFTYTTEENSAFKRILNLQLANRNHSGHQWIVGKQYYNEEGPRINVSSKGSYPVSLVVRNEFGCYDTATQYIVINEDYNLLAPSAFTPNDDGQNDDFMPTALRNADLSYQLEIIDPKTGGTIYTTSRTPWNGINQTTGNRADPGTYLWVVRLTKSDNTREVFKGSVVILPR